MADIFISYTSSDREWAFWIAKELEALRHTPHVHEWEIEGGDDIYGWMEQRHDAADHVLCVISDEYLKAPYSTLERHAALWQAASKRPGFVLLVVVKPCKLPTLSDFMRRCTLFGITETAARSRFHEFIENRQNERTVSFPGKTFAVSNIPIPVPTHFMGREDALIAIDTELNRHNDRVVIAALHGLRGVGKTTLTTAYAERHRSDYRATWWIRAQNESGIRADLTALGVRLNWVGADEKEESALTTVMERLRHEGEGMLLIFDNAPSAEDLQPYLPRGGHAKVLVTSNSHTLGRLATEPIEIKVWPAQIGADYLIARTRRVMEREAAFTLTSLLGGLPLAHEQAAAYCERLGISLAEYCKRFEANPEPILDNQRSAPQEYNGGMTVARTFALAIEEACKIYPAAETLIFYAALLAPEPIPLFLFAEGREYFGEPLSSELADDGLDEGVAALRFFALVDRVSIPDERDPTVSTDCIDLHRLVRQVAAARRKGNTHQDARRSLIQSMTSVYLQNLDINSNTWPKVRRLDGLAMALVGGDAALPTGAEEVAASLMIALAHYRLLVHSAYGEASELCQRAVAIRENIFGPVHPLTAVSLRILGSTLQAQGDLTGAQAHLERALAITGELSDIEDVFTLSGLASLLSSQGKYREARPLFERALAIQEAAYGAEHPKTASSLIDLASCLKSLGDPASAKALYKQAIAINEHALGPSHPDTASSIRHLASLLRDEGQPGKALPLLERALAIRESALSLDHPSTVSSLIELGDFLRDQGDFERARPLLERALAIRERTFGPDHSITADAISSLAFLTWDRGDPVARSLFERVLAIQEKALGSEHPHTVNPMQFLALLLWNDGDPAAARPLLERVLAIRERVLGPDHPQTVQNANNLASLLENLGYAEEAGSLRRR